MFKESVCLFQKIVCGLILTSITLSVCAEDKKPWEVSVDLGAISTSGNTDTKTLQAKVDAKQNLEKWTNQYVLSGLYKEDQVLQPDPVNPAIQNKVTQKTAEKYLGSVKSSYALSTDKSYLFGFGSRTLDKFGAYRTYNTLSLGYGDWLYSTPELNWFVEVGPGYFKGEQVRKGATATDPDILVEQDGAMLRGASTLIWHISKTAEFKEALSVEAGDSNTRTVSETSLATTITNSVQLKVGFTVSSDRQVAPGKKKTDTMSFVNLSYTFK